MEIRMFLGLYKIWLVEVVKRGEYMKAFFYGLASKRPQEKMSRLDKHLNTRKENKQN